MLPGNTASREGVRCGEILRGVIRVDSAEGHVTVVKDSKEY